MTKNKVIHARIDDDIHDRLFEKCNELGCSFTDYIQSIISASLEEIEPKKEEFEPVPKVSFLKNVRIEES